MQCGCHPFVQAKNKEAEEPPLSDWRLQLGWFLTRVHRVPCFFQELELLRNDLHLEELEAESRRREEMQPFGRSCARCRQGAISDSMNFASDLPLSVSICCRGASGAGFCFQDAEEVGRQRGNVAVAQCRVSHL